jgi:hypothetical protein
MGDIGSLHAVQNHVHDADDIGQRFLFFAEKGSLLQRLQISGTQLAVVPEILKGFAEEPGRACRAVIDSFPDLRLHHLDDGLDQRARGVVFAAVASGVAHVLDLVLIEAGHFMLFRMGAKFQLINALNHVSQVVATLNLVFDLAEDFADFILNRVRPFGFGLKLLQIGKKLMVNKILQIVAAAGRMMVYLTRPVFGSRPRLPLKFRLENGSAALPGQFGPVLPLLLKIIKILEKKYP